MIKKNITSITNHFNGMLIHKDFIMKLPSCLFIHIRAGSHVA